MARDFELPGIVPWGRRLDEYAAFFDLGPLAAWRSVLDVGAGPSSFTAEASAQGLRSVAADPLYREGGDSIRRGFEAARPAMMAGLARAAERFVWGHYGTPAALERKRQEALELFLEDYEWGRACGRYLAAALPALPFADGSFALALCSHLLCLYDDALDSAFHLAALAELCRVAGEVRVFPLIALDGRPSPHLAPVLAALRRQGLTADTPPVPFEFQRGANRMLRVRRQS